MTGTIWRHQIGERVGVTYGMLILGWLPPKPEGAKQNLRYLEMPPEKSILPVL